MASTDPHDATDSFAPAFVSWLAQTMGEQPIRLRPLSGGKSNVTAILSTDAGDRVLRCPPASELDESAHSMSREHRILTALAATDVPTPAPLALCDDAAILGTPFLIMEFAPGLAPLDVLPAAYAHEVGAAGRAIVEALARLHSVDWVAAGLEGFGRPNGFLDRQVPRWAAQFERSKVRELPYFTEIATWLVANQPPAGAPGIMHGDFHADNCLLDLQVPRVSAIVDWEMSTIGDPLLDLGLLLAFWGSDRPAPRSMAWVQAFSYVDAAPTREELASAYAQHSGRSVEHLPYYMTLAFWKLAAIIEGAYANYVGGRTDDDYARGLAEEVPRLLAEARGFSAGMIA